MCGTGRTGWTAMCVGLSVPVTQGGPLSVAPRTGWSHLAHATASRGFVWKQAEAKWSVTCKHVPRAFVIFLVTLSGAVTCTMMLQHIKVHTRRWW